MRPTAVIFLLISTILSFGLLFCTTPADGDGDGDGDGDHPRLVWTYATGGAVVAKPAVYEGNVFIGSRDGNFYCLAAVDGAEVWRFAADGPILERASVEYDPGEDVLVFFNSHTDDGWESSKTLFALNAADGIEEWRKDLAGVLTTGPSLTAGLVFADGHYAPTDTNDLYCLAQADGAEVWRYPSGTFMTSTAVNYYIYLAEYNEGNFVTCLDNADGSVVWQSPATNYIHRRPELHGDFLYTADGFGVLAARNASDGSVAWEYASGTDFPSKPESDGTYVVFAADDTVYCLDAVSGAEVWERTYDGAEISGVAVAEGSVFFGRGNTVSCLAAADASVVWEYNVPGIVEDGVPAVVEGFVYIGDFSGNVYCLRADPAPE